MGKDINTSYIGRMEYFIQENCLNLSLYELRLYLHLFHLNNKAMWREWFEVNNITLAAYTGLSERNMIRAKNSLKEKGLIDFIPGRRGKPSRYRLSTPGELENLLNYTVKIDSISDSVTDSVTDSEKSSKRPILQGSAGSLRHKTKDIRHREKKKGKPFSPPTLEDVRAYVQEKNLPIDPKYFFDYFTAGDWHDSNGKQVRSWKQKALTWARHSKQEPSPSMASIEEQREWQQEEEKRQLAYIKSLGAKT